MSTRTDAKCSTCPATMRIPEAIRERVAQLCEASNPNPLLRVPPSELLRAALEIGIESKRLSG